MGTTKRKHKPHKPHKIPEDTQRCEAICTTGKNKGQRCPKARVKGEKYCYTHIPGKAKELGALGGAVISDRKRLANEAAARWDIQSFGDTLGHLLRDMEELEAVRKKVGDQAYNVARAKLWALILEAQKAQATYEGGGSRVVVMVQQQANGKVAYNEPDKDRPDPKTVIPEEGDGFNPPAEAKLA